MSKKLNFGGHWAGFNQKFVTSDNPWTKSLEQSKKHPLKSDRKLCIYFYIPSACH